jgi:hypothetical protein
MRSAVDLFIAGVIMLVVFTKGMSNVLGALWLTPWHFTSGFWDATCEQRWEWSGAIPRPRHCDKLTSDYE